MKADDAAEQLNMPALADWLAAHIEGFRAPFSATKFPGGQSNPTYRIDTPGKSFVLRRKPFGAVLQSAHAIDREFQLISAIHPLGFPAPRPLGICRDESVIGAMFYVMDLVEGRTFWDGALPGLSPPDRRAIYHAMIDTQAKLHAIDFDAAGLSEYGRAGNYMSRQVKRWIGQYRASETDRVEAMERLIEWLPNTVPAQARTAIVHGDYRIDNLVFAHNSPSVCAVLDWELSTLGDPLADFSYLALNWVLPADGGAGLAGLDVESLGIPSLRDAIERYCNTTAQEAPSTLDWYFSYNLFRIAAIVQGIKKRLADGIASSADAAQKAARVSEFAETAWQFAVKSGAN